MSVIVSPNMGLQIPVVGNEIGPNYANDVNNSLSILDAHTHNPGSGVQITPSGLNINTNLPFLGNSATQLLSANFNSQISALSGTNFVSFVNGNLYVNDGSGNQIQMTSGGGVAGSPGSIGSLTSPASASYSSASKTFSWFSNSSAYAAMNNGAVTIFQTNVASVNGITISSPNSLAASYGLTLPPELPASNQYLYSSSGGSLSFSTPDQIGQAMTSVGANAILVSSTKSTGTTVGIQGVAIGAQVTHTVGSQIFFPDGQVTITTSGRPIVCMIVGSDMDINPSSTAVLYSVSMNIFNMTQGTNVGSGIVGGGKNGNPGGSSSFVVDVPASYVGIDIQPAGTYTYQMVLNGGAKNISNVNVSWIATANAQLVVYELD